MVNFQCKNNVMRCYCLRYNNIFSCNKTLSFPYTRPVTIDRKLNCLIFNDFGFGIKMKLELFFSSRVNVMRCYCLGNNNIFSCNIDFFILLQRYKQTVLVVLLKSSTSFMNLHVSRSERSRYLIISKQPLLEHVII